MKTYFLIVTFLLGTLMSVPVEGQTFLEKMAKKAAEKAEKKAEQKAEEKAEEKIDEQIDKGLNAAEESMQDQNDQDAHKKGTEADQQKRLSDLMSKMGMSSEPVDVEEAYTFQSSITMNVKNYEKDGTLQSDGDIISFVTPGEETFAYEFVEGEMHASNRDQKGVFIMDFKNEATIILSDDKGKKTGIIYGMKGFMDQAQMDEDEDAEAWEDETTPPDSPLGDPNVKKTGRSKSILGYKCEEYRYEDENDITHFWITKEYKWDSKDFMSNVFKTSLYSRGMPWGFLMESEALDKESGEKSMYTVKDIDKNANKTFRLSDYQLTNLGSMNIPTE